MSGPDHIFDFLGRTRIHGVLYSISREQVYHDSYMCERWRLVPANRREARRRAPTVKQLLIFLICEHDSIHEVWALLKSMCGDNVYGPEKMLRRLATCVVVYDPIDRIFTLTNKSHIVKY